MLIRQSGVLPAWLSSCPMVLLALLQEHLVLSNVGISWHSPFQVRMN